MESNSLIMMPRSPTPPPPSLSPNVKAEVHSFAKTTDENSRDSVTSFTAEESAMRQNQVSTVILHRIPIVCLFIDGRERLCLAQISNTLLKDYSYNEIHNRRVALGITCVQCTPVQLEILRRAGAMPISSRRCGMISKREAERLVKSFLEEHMPPKLPENFAFCVKHPCGWGCKGQFVPSRYNSSRAKCIKCNYCSLFFSPNKFIFHFHRVPDAKYRHPDAANFNSWRRHLFLDYEVQNEDLVHAWEDVKAMFNGGSRKRVLGSMVKADVDYISFEKKSKFDTAQAPLPSFPVSCPPQPSSNHQHPYPFISMTSTVNHNNGMVMPYQTQPNYPMLPRAANTSIKGMQDSTKTNFTDIWKNRTTPMYNPFGFWWAKNFGMPAFGQATKSTFPVEWGFWQNNKEPLSNESKSDADSRYSAFKPVGLLGSRVFSEYNRNSTTDNEKTPNWEASSREAVNKQSFATTESFNRDKASHVYKEDRLEQPSPEGQTEVDNESICGSEQGSDVNFSEGQDVDHDFDICVDESQDARPRIEVPRNPDHEQLMYGLSKSNIQVEETEHSRYNGNYGQPVKRDLGHLDVKCETESPAEEQSSRSEVHSQSELSPLSPPKSENQASRSTYAGAIMHQPYNCEEKPRDIYEMSKEELQRELVRMMTTKEQNTQ